MGAVGFPHDFGVLVTPEWIVWYIDSKEVRRRPNLDFHEPAYMLLNLAIGGEWPGKPDKATHFPARMTIHRVRAYSLKPDLNVE
jgi:beta-glucanase (GH16 family)